MRRLSIAKKWFGRKFSLKEEGRMIFNWGVRTISKKVRLDKSEVEKR